MTGRDDARAHPSLDELADLREGLLSASDSEWVRAHVDSCSSCHEAIPEHEPVRFSPAAGGATCPRCLSRSPGGRSLPPEARDALRAFIGGGGFDLAEERVRRAHLRLLREFLHQHLSDGKELRALDSWERGETAASNA